MLLLSLVAFNYAYAVVSAQPCNPLENTCSGVIPGFTEPYSVDFSQQSTLPSEWILADYATVTFSEEKGANFSFLKRYDAPYIWTRNYFLFGRVDVELQAAPGNGLITGAVVMSDDKDELDWEFSGNNFGQGQDNGLVQTNWFGKGVAGSYSRGTQQAVDSPQTKFHTYSYDWTKDGVKWILDGNEIHSIKNNGDKSGEYQFPQTPSRLHLGIWNAGDPDTPAGTMNWAGGLLDMNKVPYSAYVKSVKITPYMACSSWQYPSNFSGNWEDIECTNQTVSVSTSSATSSASQAITTAYTVKAGDNGSQIAQSLGCSFEQLKAANPGVNWNLLLIGQSLNIPGVLKPQVVANSTRSAENTLSSDNAKSTSATPLSTLHTGYGNSSNPIMETKTTLYTGTNTVATLTSTMPGSVKPYSTCATVTVTVTAPCRGEASPSAMTETSSTNILTGSHYSTSTQSLLSPSNKSTSSGDSSLKSKETLAPKSGSKIVTLLTQNTIKTTPTTTFLQTQGITIQTEVVKDSTTVSSTVLPGSATAVYPSSQTKAVTTQALGSTMYSQNTLVDNSGDSIVTVWSTKAVTSIMTLTAPCTVCQTITSGTLITTSCKQSVNTTLIATEFDTVIPITTRSNTAPISTSFLTSQSQSLNLTNTVPLTQSTAEQPKNSTTSIPTVPFLTTITVPCSSCSKGVKTITSTCSTVTSVATITVACPICPDGVTTTTTTTKILLTHTPSSSLPPFLNSSTVIDLKHVNTTSATLGTVPFISTSVAMTKPFSSPATVLTSTILQVYSTSSLTLSSHSSIPTLGSSNITHVTTSSYLSISKPVSTTSLLSITYPRTSNVTTLINTSGTFVLAPSTPVTSMKSSPSTSTIQSTTSTTSSTVVTTPVITTSPATTTFTVPPTCSQDACLNNMLNENHIEEAHSYAHDFCKDRAKPTPTWLTACQNKASATSAFQCVTASATPVPSEDKDGRKCFNFQGQKICGKGHAQDFHRGYQKREDHEAGAKGYLGRLWRFSKTGSKDEKHK